MVIKRENKNALIFFQKKSVELAATSRNNKIQARIMDENNLFPVTPVAETLEDAYVYCMGGKTYE